MTDQTKVDKGAIDTAADKLGGLMSDDVMKVFRDLEPNWPQAGGFVTGTFLEQRVDDRRNAIVEHADRLKIILSDMQTNLKTLSANLVDTDGDSGKLIQQQVDSMRSATEGHIGEHDDELEAKQHNFTPGSGGGPAPGDGYASIVGQPVQGVPKGEEHVDQSPVPSDLQNLF